MKKIYLSIVKNNLSQIELEYAQGTDLDAFDERGWNPLLWAIKQDRLKIVERLIELGVDLNVRVTKQVDWDGDLPAVVLAAGSSIHGILKSVVEAGADIDATSYLGVNALITPVQAVAKKMQTTYWIAGWFFLSWRWLLLGEN